MALLSRAIGWLLSFFGGWFGGKQGEKTRDAEERAQYQERYIRKGEAVPDHDAADTLDVMQKWNK